MIPDYIPPPYINKPAIEYVMSNSEIEDYEMPLNLNLQASIEGQNQQEKFDEGIDVIKQDYILPFLPRNMDIDYNDSGMILFTEDDFYTLNKVFKQYNLELGWRLEMLLNFAPEESHFDVIGKIKYEPKNEKYAQISSTLDSKIMIYDNQINGVSKGTISLNNDIFLISSSMNYHYGDYQKFQERINDKVKTELSIKIFLD